MDKIQNSTSQGVKVFMLINLIFLSLKKNLSYMHMTVDQLIGKGKKKKEVSCSLLSSPSCLHFLWKGFIILWKILMSI